MAGALRKGESMPSIADASQVQVPIRRLDASVRLTARKADAISPGEAPNQAVSVYELQNRALEVTRGERTAALAEVKSLVAAYQRSKGIFEVVDRGDREMVSSTEGVFPDLVTSRFGGDYVDFRGRSLILSAMEKAAKGAASKDARPPEIFSRYIDTYVEQGTLPKQHSDLYYRVTAEKRDLDNVLRAVQAVVDGWR